MHTEVKVVSMPVMRRFLAIIVATGVILAFAGPEQVEANEDTEIDDVVNHVVNKNGTTGFGHDDGPGDGFEAVAIELGATIDDYWILSKAGEVLAFGGSEHHGDLEGIVLNEPPVDLVSTPSGLGYWIVAADGGVFAFGDASYFGSLGELALNSPIVGIARTETGRGYWLFGADGGVFAFGDAGFYGSLPELIDASDLAGPVVGAIRSAAGSGYILAASDGGVFAFGDAIFRGSAVAFGGETVAIASGHPAGYNLNRGFIDGNDFGFTRPRVAYPALVYPFHDVVDVTDFRPRPES